MSQSIYNTLFICPTRQDQMEASDGCGSGAVSGGRELLCLAEDVHVPAVLLPSPPFWLPRRGAISLGTLPLPRGPFGLTARPEAPDPSGAGPRRDRRDGLNTLGGPSWIREMNKTDIS